MYTIFISNSNDEMKKTLQSICADKELLQIPSHNSSPDPDLSQFCRIDTAKGIYNIPYHEILFAESHQKKIILHCKDKTFQLPLSLYRLKEVLPSPQFIQCHRSYIINLKNISYVDKTGDPWVISFFYSDKTAFVSRTYKKDVMDVITPFLDCVSD